MVHKAMATTLCQSNSRAPQSAREPMKTQSLSLFTLNLCLPYQLGEGRVLKDGSNYCFHLFTDLLQDNNISSKAIKGNMMPPYAGIFQLTKNSKIFGKSQLY